MDKSKPFGLILAKKEKAFRPTSTAGVFGSDSEDESSSRKFISKIPQAKPLKEIKKEDLVDPSIYEYDAIYDDMKAQKNIETVSKEKKSSQYIQNLLKAADKRKKEYERRIERKVQVERESEGNKYEDKEMFVTSTYKKKLQEREEEEERERRENQINDMMDVTKQKDLSGFYRHFLKQSIGEEKIPEFGKEKFSIKKEPCSDSETEKGEIIEQNPSKPLESFPEDQDFSDSDDSSSSGESDSKISTSYEKSVREYRKRASSKESSPEANSKLEDCKKSPEITKNKHSNGKAKSYRKSKQSSEESDADGELSVQTKKQKISTSEVSDADRESLRQSIKQKISTSKEDNRHSEQISDESCVKDTNDLPLRSLDDDDSVPDSSEETSENKKAKEVESKPVRNIWEKRHVGDIFSAAQARYFQRLALRSS